MGKQSIYKLLIVAFFSSQMYSVTSQIYVYATVNDYCQGDNFGSIVLDFNNDIELEYELPYQAEWENITSGDLG